MNAPPSDLETASEQPQPTPVDPLARIRHDLRTPASHIQGYGEMLCEEADDAGLKSLLPDLRHIEKAGRRLVELIRDELSPDRLAAGRIDLRELHSDLRTPLNHVIGYAEMLIEQVEADTETEAAATFASHRRRFLQDLQKVHQAARVFLRLIGELLVPARLESLSNHRQAVVPHAQPDALALSRELSSEVGTQQPPPAATGTILVVDDDPGNRDLLSRRLVRKGFDVLTAVDGPAALAMLRQRKVDLILLDMLMPGMDGGEVLGRLKADPRLRDIPVIMLSALDEMDSVVRCILMGAEDYLSKPFNTVLLRARLDACLEKHRLRKHEQEYLRTIEDERHKSDTLLLNILPQPIADRLKHGETTIVDSLGEVTVLFADLVGFTSMATHLSSVEVVRLLDEIFSGFDTLAEAQGLEKIKTIGDAYMVVGGLPTPRPDHAQAIAELALSMLEHVQRQYANFRFPIQLRLGINTGPVIAGIIGRHKFNYDLWGDTVNTASRMESHGLPGKIQVTEATYHRLKDHYRFDQRGEIDIKGKGRMTTWFLTARLD